MRATAAVLALSLVAGAGAFSPACLPGASAPALRSALARPARPAAVSLSMCAEVLPRRAAMGVVAGALALALAPARPAQAAKAKATTEQVVAAVASLRAAQGALPAIAELIEAADWDGTLAALSTPDFENIEASLLTLVNGPTLNIDDKKVIGTRKRYGIAADVIYGVGGVKGSIEKIGTPQIESCSGGQCSGKMVDGAAGAQKALDSLAASLKEIINICKSYKL